MKRGPDGGATQRRVREKHHEPDGEDGELQDDVRKPHLHAGDGCGHPKCKDADEAHGEHELRQAACG